MIEFLGFQFLCAYRDLTAAEQAIFEASLKRGVLSTLMDEEKTTL
jgi:hypothetical protein